MATDDGRCDCLRPDLEDGRCRRCGRSAGPRARERKRKMEEAADRVKDVARRADLDL